MSIREVFKISLNRRVLIVVENLPVPLDRRVWLEATTLEQAGYHVSVICPMGRGWNKEYEAIEGVHIYRYPVPEEAHSSALAYAREYGSAVRHWFRLARLVWREQGFDVIHGCNPPDLIWLLALAYRKYGVRYIFDHHDVCPELFEAKFERRGLLYRLMLSWERLAFRVADVTIATNETFKIIAQDRGGKSPEDVFVVRSAPRIEQFQPGNGNPLLRKGAGTVIGYVGVIGKQEGMDLLVEAADHLIRGRGVRDVRFVIVGFGSHLAAMKADVSDRGLERHFEFPGPLYGADLVQVLNSCDIGVAPDPKNPMNDISTMNKVMEYMTLGLPVVQFDLAEGRYSAGDAGLYASNNDPYDFSDQLQRLIEDPNLRTELGKRGRARVMARLSWDHSAPELLAAYDRIFARMRRVLPATRTQPRHEGTPERTPEMGLPSKLALKPQPHHEVQ